MAKMADKEKENPRARSAALTIFAIFVLWAWLSSDSKKSDGSGDASKSSSSFTEQPSSSSSEIDPPQAHVPTIEPGAVMTYDRKNFPSLGKQWGDKGLKRIQKTTHDAAQTVAQNPTCDSVRDAGYASDESKAPSKIVIFVDCRNGKRFYVPEGATQVRSAREELADFTDRDLINACEKLIKDNAMVKASVKFGWLPDVLRNDLGHATVLHRFSATNAFGVKFDYRAMCTADRHGNVRLSGMEQR